MPRKLATIRRIGAIAPIPGANAIEVAVIDGWEVVVKKGQFTEHDLAVYCEIDSFIPTSIAPFLSHDSKKPKVFNDIEGQPLKTIKLRGQISQGLALAISDIPALAGVQVSEGMDVSELLGIVKYEPPVPARLSGTFAGYFPNAIKKTDQERIQNLAKKVNSDIVDHAFEVTEKVEGTSMTVFMHDGRFGICSRNYELLIGGENDTNTLVRVARELELEKKLRQHGLLNIALQGELIGPGIQGNIYGLDHPQFLVFDVFDILRYEYLSPDIRKSIVNMLGLSHVPVIEPDWTIPIGTTIGDIVGMADGMSELHATLREGLVFKRIDGKFSFKAISNQYLLGAKN